MDLLGNDIWITLNNKNQSTINLVGLRYISNDVYEDTGWGEKTSTIHYVMYLMFFTNKSEEYSFYYNDKQTMLNDYDKIIDMLKPKKL